MQGVAEKFGMRSIHLPFVQQVNLIRTVFPTHLLLAAISDQFRMFDESSAPRFQVGCATDDLIQLRFNGSVCIEQIPERFEILSSLSLVAKEALPTVPIAWWISVKRVVSSER